MRRPDLRYCMFGVCAAASTFAGCGGSSTLQPIAAPQAGMHAAAKSSATAASRMSAVATGVNLLYVSDLGANSVDVYTYAKGKLVGKLTGFGSVAGLCADKAGDVFVVDEAGPVRVFAHGGTTPIRELQTSGAPNSCAVDASTGNLAVTQLSSYLDGAISIYLKAKGKPKVYFDRANIDATFFCSYDGRGNLYVDGWDRSANAILVQLPKGRSTFAIGKINKSVQTPSGVQWDGKYVAIGDKGAGLIYRTNAAGQVAQTIKLQNGTDVDGFWIQGKTLVGPDARSGGAVGFWTYPSGGTPAGTVSWFYYPIDVTVSLAR
jgi:hypothetical protein